MGQPAGVTGTGGRKPSLSERGEVKHLSTPRKRNQRDSLSSGERTGNSPNLWDVKDSGLCPKGVMGPIGGGRKRPMKLQNSILV